MKSVYSSLSFVFKGLNIKKKERLLKNITIFDTENFCYFTENCEVVFRDYKLHTAY